MEIEMSARDELRKYPLTTIGAAFLAGFATSSGLSSAAVTATVAITKNPAVRRVALVAWPLVRQNLSDHVKESATGFVKDIFRNATSGSAGKA